MPRPGPCLLLELDRLAAIRAAAAWHDLEALYLVANLLIENDVSQVNDALRAGVGVRVLFG